MGLLAAVLSVLAISQGICFFENMVHQMQLWLHLFKGSSLMQWESLETI